MYQVMNCTHPSNSQMAVTSSDTGASISQARERSFRSVGSYALFLFFSLSFKSALIASSTFTPYQFVSKSAQAKQDHSSDLAHMLVALSADTSFNFSITRLTGKLAEHYVLRGGTVWEHMEIIFPSKANRLFKRTYNGLSVDSSFKSPWP